MLPSRIVTLCLVLGVASLAQGSQYPIEEIPDLIPPAHAAKLKAAGVTTTKALLEQAATTKARRQLARASKVSANKLVKYVHAADLMRVRGIGPKMVRVLGHVKVRRLAELKRQNAARLTAALKKAQPKLEAGLREKLPDEKTFANWIDQAKALPALVK